MLSRIRERKLVQWVVAYVVGAFVVLQGLELVTEAFPPFAIVLQTVLVLTGLGLPVVIVLAWFHGEKGRQRVSLAEALILGVVVLGAGALVFQLDVYGSSSPGPELEPVTATLDSTRYVVLPFRRDPAVGGDLNEAALIHDALARWDGIELVDFVRLQDALAGLDDGASPDLRRIAAEMGAGRYVSGTLSVVGSRIRMHATLFDTRAGTPLADTTVHIGPAAPLPEPTARGIVASLLFPGADPTAEGLEVGTRSVPARRAFLHGRRALRDGGLMAADSLIAEAIEADPGFGRALFWRAQVQNWSGRPPAEVLTLVLPAAAHREQLTERERSLADALLLLARGEYAESCDVYATLREADDRDFAAWFGLGECRAQDDVVVGDPDSPSGWAFRSSYHRAAQAYRRAFQLLPTPDLGISSPAFRRLGERLKVSTGEVRRGRALSPDTLAFLARPGWVGDTLAFIPYPAADVAEGRPGTRPATHWPAVERQRRLYNEIAESWVARFPRNPEALEALAYAREFLADPRALETLETARGLADDAGRRAMMAAEKVKLLVKFGAPEQLTDARLLADSVLSTDMTATRDEMRTLAVVAALTGRAHRAARLVRDAAAPFEWTVRLPAAVMGPAAALDAYAALGAPEDSIVANEDLFEAALENRVAPEDRPIARSMLLRRAASLSYLSHRLDSFEALARETSYPVLRAQGAHARGDHAEALQVLTDIREARRRANLRPAEISFDALLPESALWAALGDTATAVVVLDGTLNTLRWSEPGSLTDAVRAASLVRAMAFRAELAAATGDLSTARRWATTVATLWADADEPLQPVVRRMRRIASER